MTWWQKKPFIDGINAYEKTSDREQKIVHVTFITLLLLLCFLLIIEPLFLASQALHNEQKSIEAINSKITIQIDNTLATQYQDPNDALRQELESIDVEANKYQEQIGLLTKALVAPKQMVSLLENVLTQDKQLKLISLNNLPEQGMSIDGSMREKPDKDRLLDESEALIYQHGFEIELEATYKSSVDYLKRLDKLPWQLFWKKLEYESTQYPKGRLKIRIYTLSMSKAVLGV